MLVNSPERSYKRLNPALRDTLANCIAANLPFETSTFQRIHNELRGGWWFGDGAGSSIGEHFYTQACSLGHASAQQSFEHFAERPACLWEQDTKTPSRLYVGARFSWKGYYVTVTSMRTDSLIACTYKDCCNEVRGLKVGTTFGYSPGYLIVTSKRKGNATDLRVVPASKTEGEREIAKRFTIPYAEITHVRKTVKARLKAILTGIASCDPERDNKTLTAEINAAHFRHFELEDVQAAFQARKNWISNQAALENWRKGVNGAFLDIKAVALRVNGDLVECSNGNSVSRAAASRALPVLLHNRTKTMPLALPLDGYTINRIGTDGVKVGCTLVPWSEIDLIALRLTKA